jgi:hypothetical protein
MFTNGLFDFINTRASIAQRSIKKPEQWHVLRTIAPSDSQKSENLPYFNNILIYRRYSCKYRKVTDLFDSFPHHR